jgi:serine/threonine protein kinase
MIDREIGTYKILEQIGEGGMGVVYKALDTSLDRPVAIKMLARDLAHDPELVSRFRSEARAQANLNHINIATLYSFLQVEGQCLIVMEYLEGETFEDLLSSRGRIPWEGAVSLTRQALLGLGLAHDRGIIHRDIKPGNLILTKTGIVKVMDFGIAKALGGQTKTRTGIRMGTARYMSPEQIRGQQIDPRSDIYSLGVTLYELLTGSLPFQSDSDFDLMSAHIQTPPPLPTNLCADIPKGLEKCVLKAMAKDPADRFQGAAEFGANLEQIFTSPTDRSDRKEIDETRQRLGSRALPPTLLDGEKGAVERIGFEVTPGEDQKNRDRRAQPVTTPPFNKWLVGSGLALYAVSFALYAVERGTAPMRGWDCAVESLIIPWQGSGGLLSSHAFKSLNIFLPLSLLISGSTNLVFLVAILLKTRNKFRKASTVLAKITLTVFPFCWVVFLWLHYYPREGYFAWVLGMLLALYPSLVSRFIRPRTAG